MDLHYTPHTDEPIYNLIFRLYRENKINLNTDVIGDMIQRVEAMSTEEYLAQFKPMLDHKYGSKMKGKRAEMDEKLKRRKEGIRAEYTRFFKENIGKDAGFN